MKRTLTPLQKRFTEEYIKDLNPEKAAIRAGYSKANAYTRAEALLNDPYIVEEIKRLIKSQTQKLRVEKSYIIEKLLNIAEFSLTVEEVLDKNGNPTGIKKFRDTAAGMKALELLGKHSASLESHSDVDNETPKINIINNLDENKI